MTDKLFTANDAKTTFLNASNKKFQKILDKIRVTASIGGIEYIHNFDSFSDRLECKHFLETLGYKCYLKDAFDLVINWS